VKRCLALCTLVVAATSLRAQERYGFVAMLGRDTISIERIARTGDHLVSDEVERFPRVVQRHTEITLAPDGSVRHFEMDIILPTAVTAKWHERHVTADYAGDSIVFTLRNGEGTQSETQVRRGALVMPWSGQVYSLTELYCSAAIRRGGDSIPVQLFYADAQIGEFGLAPGLVRVRRGVVEIRNDGLAGIGEATLNGNGRMLAYSGARSTYKMEVRRIPAPPEFDALSRGFADAERANGVTPSLSVRDTTRAAVGGATLMLDYGRPLARGRALLGSVIPLDTVWRTGANAATQLRTSAPISLGGLELAPGTYSLWTLPSAGGVQLIVNRQSGQWGTQYDPSRDLGRTPLHAETVVAPVEQFTISVLPGEPGRGTLVLEWGNFRWTAPILAR
jgi:hypothetical protein